MPANLSQQYRNAEKLYRNCSTLEEELQCLQLMLREIPKHKGTDKLQADLKRKISKAKAGLQNRAGRSSASGFRLARQGAGRVVLVGGTNSGKTQLFNSLTQSTAEVAEFPFTTRVPIPGLMPFEDIQIQLVDTAPVASQNYDPKTESLVRGAELVLCLVDLGDDDSVERFVEMFDTIQHSRSRLDSENRIDPDDIGVTYTQCFLIWNKFDLPESAERKSLFSEMIVEQFGELPFRTFDISASEKIGLDRLSEAIFESLKVVRIYTKDPAKKEPDFEHPFTLPQGASVLDLARLVHEEVAAHFQNARVWGDGKHDGTKVNSTYELHDKDIVEIKTR